ncbi:MAG: OmpA family protein [candidate division KSB1 bacterium]|nr:OmpA family protein [candidate division KSB1 bacterium]
MMKRQFPSYLVKAVELFIFIGFVQIFPFSSASAKSVPRFSPINAGPQDSLSALKNLFLKSATEFIRLKQWDRAIDAYKHYLEAFPAEKERIVKIIKILEAPDQGVTIENLGDSINTKYHEYYPVITTDNQSLYFTARHRPGGLGGEDVWVSHRTAKGWSKAVNLGPPINTEDHEGFMCLSADGLTAFLFGNYPDSYGKGDIFYSVYQKDGWSEVKNIGKPINSPDFEADAWFCSDGTTVFFVSDRPGGIGDYRPRDERFLQQEYNTDIYVSIKTDTGWCKPINLGERINTPYCERGPIFHADGRTLFFCSSGHPGLGDLDIFVAYKTGDSWTDWSEPENLGKEINTIYKDWGYSISLEGDEVYFASIREDGMGKSDLYRAKFSKKFTIPITMVTGKLRDRRGQMLDSVRLEWEDIEKFKQLGTAYTRPRGDYTIFLPAGRWYRYTATKKGYIFASRDIDLRREEKPKVNYDIELPKITPESVPFPPALLNVFFKLDSSELLPESKSELDRFLKLIRENPQWIKIEISGHTCDLGSDKHNKILSQSRAQAVVDYMVAQGESPDRFIAKGYGFEQPLYREFTDEARKRNRRVEFRVLELDTKSEN